MRKFKNDRLWAVFLVGLMVFVSSCSVAEQVGERVAEEAAEQVLGEGAVATSEAFVSAVATEAAGLATSEAGGEAGEAGEVNESEEQSEPEASDSVAKPESGQNDGNSGGDAGMGDDPLPVQPGAGLPGLLTGVQNGADLFDVYQIQVGADQVVRLTVSSLADNSAEMWFDLGNDDGYDASVMVMPGESADLVMGSSNEQLYKLEVSHSGDAQTAGYTFDVIIENQNDAGSAGDAPNNFGQAMLISEMGVAFRGASIGNGTGANDFDCYQVNLPTENGSVSIDLTVPVDQPNEVHVRGELYDGTGELLTSNTAEFGSSISLAFGVESYEEAVAGAYSFCLESYSFYAYGEYEFTVTIGDGSGG